MTLEEKILHLRVAAMEEARAEENAIMKRHEDALRGVFEQQALFAEVEEELQNFMKTEEYLELLEKYIEKAARFADGEEMTIYINQTDADKKEYLEKDTGMKLTISTEDFVGGIRAVIHEKNILIDHAYKGALENEYHNFLFKGGAGIG